jgi:methionyl-tRNA formyltransferase
LKKYPGIIFFGTPEFAVPSLKSLIESGYPVVGVVTSPDKPAGRGLHIQPPAVKAFAGSARIPALQPNDLTDPGFIDELTRLKPELGIVIAFRKLPPVIWSLPPLGTFNLHASLLPQYRGAAPIQRAIMNGESETGLTTFLLDEQIDTGKILFREKILIGRNETSGQLHDRMMALGSKLVIRTVEALAGGNYSPVSQDEICPEGTVLTRAPKIFKEDCRIDWHHPVHTIYNKIRGLSPHPGAYTDLRFPDGTIRQLKIYSAIPEFRLPEESPGQFICDRSKTLKMSAEDGYILLEEIQLPGKKPMKIQEFLRGYGYVFSQNR